MKNRFILTPFFLAEALTELEALAEPDWDLNRPGFNEIGKLQWISELHRPLAEWVHETAKAGDRPVSIAGDCCSAIGVMAGLRRAGIRPTLLWLDAHGDFNTWETSPSGFLGGMPLAMLVGRGEQSLLSALQLEPFPEERVILADARDLDPGEQEAVAGSKLTHLGTVHALTEIELPSSPLYVHFDTDVLNPEEAPAMSFPVKGGPTTGELREVFRYLSRTGNIVAVSLSSWNPAKEEAEKTRQACMGLLRDLVIG